MRRVRAGRPDRRLWVGVSLPIRFLAIRGCYGTWSHAKWTQLELQWGWHKAWRCTCESSA